MYWFNSFHRIDYKNILDLFNTFDVEAQIVKNEIKNYEDPMNLSPRSKVVNNQTSFLTNVYRLLGLRNV
jgi:hypothetical protein